jgi:hypothetical protein
MRKGLERRLVRQRVKTEHDSCYFCADYCNLITIDRIKIRNAAAEIGASRLHTKH